MLHLTKHVLSVINIRFRNAFELSLCNKKQLPHAKEEIMTGKRKNKEIKEGFVEGSCCMLRDIRAVTLQNIVSSTISHLLVCQGGMRFKSYMGFNIYFMVT